MAAGDLLSTTLHLLHRASQRADGLFMRRLLNGEITPRQFAVLDAVASKDGLSQTDIMNAAGIDRSSVAELVKRLVKNGCLQRRRTRRDARVYSVRITATGRKLLAVATPAARRVEEEILSRFSRQERETFLKVLSAMATNAGNG